MHTCTGYIHYRCYRGGCVLAEVICEVCEGLHVLMESMAVRVERPRLLQDTQGFRSFHLGCRKDHDLGS